MAAAPKNTTVVIQGSLTPAVGHPRRGVRIAVPLTDNVKDLEAKGYITFVADEGEGVPDVPVDVVAPEPVEPVEPTEPAEVAEVAEGEAAQTGESTDDPGQTRAAARK